MVNLKEKFLANILDCYKLLIVKAPQFIGEGGKGGSVEAKWPVKVICSGPH